MPGRLNSVFPSGARESSEDTVQWGSLAPPEKRPRSGWPQHKAVADPPQNRTPHTRRCPLRSRRSPWIYYHRTL